MKISGFTIIRNALQNDYPIVEAIKSILPIVDEMIVLVGDSADSTQELIASINDDKIRIINSVWDPSLRKGGAVLAVETDKAFNEISADSDWAFYIQGDEVVHEKYHAAIKESCHLYKDQMEVEGMLFNYVHFYGTYDYVGDSRRWYNKEVRIIRNDKKIKAYRDAQGFRKDNRKLMVKPVNAFIYHYGWVKSPSLMKQKLNNSYRLWHNDTVTESFIKSTDVFDFNDFDSLQRFEVTHPLVMQTRIKKADWNLDLDISVKRLPLKDRLLYYVEKKLGKRLFAYKNYKVIK